MEDKDLLGRRVGRPLKNGSKNKYCGVRLTEEEERMLTYLNHEMELTNSDVLRKALKFYYNYMVNQL